MIRTSESLRRRGKGNREIGGVRNLTPPKDVRGRNSHTDRAEKPTEGWQRGGKTAGAQFAGKEGQRLEGKEAG